MQAEARFTSVVGMCDESLWENRTHNVSQFTQQQPQQEAVRTWHPPGAVFH